MNCFLLFLFESNLIFDATSCLPIQAYFLLHVCFDRMTCFFFIGCTLWFHVPTYLPFNYRKEFEENKSNPRVSGGGRPKNSIVHANIRTILPGVWERDCGARGYCGYRSCAFALFGDENRYKDVIADILDYLLNHDQLYVYFSNQENIFSIQNMNELLSANQHPPGDLREYVTNMHDFVASNLDLPPHYWLNNMSVQVLAMVYNINVIVYCKPTSSSPYLSFLCRLPVQHGMGSVPEPQELPPPKLHSIALHCRNVEHWTALLPTKENRERIYPIAQSCLEENIFNSGFHTIQDENFPEVLSENSQTLNFDSGRFFKFALTGPPQPQPQPSISNPCTPSVSMTSRSLPSEPQPPASLPPKPLASVTNSTLPSEDMSQFEWLFEKNNLIGLKKQCPHCCSKVKDFSTLLRHWRHPKKCTLGKYYATWKENTAPSLASTPISETPRKRKRSPSPVAGRKQRASHLLTLPPDGSEPSISGTDSSRPFDPDLNLGTSVHIVNESVFKDKWNSASSMDLSRSRSPSPTPSCASDLSTCSVRSTSSLASKESIIVHLPSGEVEFDPSTTNCSCGFTSRSRIVFHWSTKKSCEQAKVYQMYVKDKFIFSETKQSVYPFMGTPSRSASGSVPDSAKFCKPAPPTPASPFLTPNSRSRSNAAPSRVSTAATPRSKSLFRTPESQTHPGVSSPASASKQPIIFHLSTGDEEFDPTDRNCSCRTKEFEKIACHWRQSSSCPRAITFMNNIPKGVTFSNQVQHIRPSLMVPSEPLREMPTFDDLPDLPPSSTANVEQKKKGGENEKNKPIPPKLFCQICLKPISSLRSHETNSPTCKAVRLNLDPSSISDKTVSTYLDLSSAEKNEKNTAPHSFSETRDPLVRAVVTDLKRSEKKAREGEKLSAVLQAQVDQFERDAESMRLPGFPWDPEGDKIAAAEIHGYFKEWNDALYEVVFRKCDECFCRKMRTPVLGLDVCPDCIAKRKGDASDEKFVNEFLQEYKYPEYLPKLTPAEVSVIAYYQPAVNVTYSPSRGLRYRLQRLVLTKHPADILDKISQVLPRPKCDDEVRILRNVNDKERVMVVNGYRVKLFMEHLIHNHTFYMEKYNHQLLFFDNNWPDGDVAIATTVVNNSDRVTEPSNGTEPSQNPDPSPGDENSSSDSDGSDDEESMLPQGELKSDVAVETYSISNPDRLYQKKNTLAMQGKHLTIVDKAERAPVDNFIKTDLTAAFPHLYYRGRWSPMSDPRHAKIRLRLATLIDLCVEKEPSADDPLESKFWYPFEEDTTHVAICLAHAQNQEAFQKMTWFVTKFPSSTSADIVQIIEALLKGPQKDRTFDTSKILDLDAHLAQMKQAPQRWQEERKNIETVQCDSGDANKFFTLNMNCRYWSDVHNMLHQVIYDEPMTDACYGHTDKGLVSHGGKPCFIPKFVSDQGTFEKIMERYAGKIEVYLDFRTQTYREVWIHKVCRIPKKEGDFSESLDRNTPGYYWWRAEYTALRGIQHWHSLNKLPGVLHLPSLVRIMNRGRQARQELRKDNVKKKLIPRALEYVRLGLLAHRYLCSYSDSLVHMEFLKDPSVGSRDPENHYNLNNIRQGFDKVLNDARKGCGLVNPVTLPLLKPYVYDEDDEAGMVERMAQVAAFTCIHRCIKSACKGNTEGCGCRFGFPRKKMPVTVPGTVWVNDTFCETHIYHKRSSRRTSNTNKFHLLYWGANHDVQVILNFSQGNRYVTKYVTKSVHSDAFDYVLQKILSDQDNFLQLTREGVLMRCFSSANMYRSDLTRHQLMFLAHNLEERVCNFTVKPVSIYPSTKIETVIKDGVETVEDLSEKTIYCAYAERINCTNDKEKLKETHSIDLANISFYDFVGFVSNHRWVDEEGKTAEKGYRNRNVDSGNRWEFTFRKSSCIVHTRIRNLIQCPPPIDYDISKNRLKEWEDLTRDEKNMLYRAHDELVLFVPWERSPEKTFLSEGIRKKVDGLTDEKKEKTKERLEAFFTHYRQLHREKLVAQPGTAWHRQNQYLFSMFLGSEINKSVRENRAENEGVFKPKFAAGNDENLLLDEGIPSVYEFLDGGEVPQYNLPEKGIDFEIAEQLRSLPPHSLENIRVIHREAEYWKNHERFITKKSLCLFAANPPAPRVPVSDFLPPQLFAFQLAVDPNGPQVIFIYGLAGSGKTAVAEAIVAFLRSKGNNVQICAPTAKAASQFNAPTFHGAFGLGTNVFQQMSDLSMKKLRGFYNQGRGKENGEYTHFIIDEVGNLSAESLARANSVLQRVFCPDSTQAPPPWGGRKMIFMGDPLQLPPVSGTNLIDLTNALKEMNSSVSGREYRKKKQEGKFTSKLATMGRGLFQTHLCENVIVFDKCHRSQGLLPRIMDEVRNAKTTPESHEMLMHLGKKFQNTPFDRGVFHKNEIREKMNHLQGLKRAAKDKKPIFVSFADYNVKEKVTERFVRSLPAQEFGGAQELLLLYEGMEVTLIKNIDTKSGLINGATGKIVSVCYEHKDVQPLTEGHHPQPTCVIVDFPDFKGHVEGDPLGQKEFGLEKKTWVAIYPMKFRLDSPKGRSTSALFTEGDEHCRIQFPFDSALCITVHRAQGQTWADRIIYISIGLSQKNIPTSEDTALLYTAGTRSNKLQHCIFEEIPLDTWLKLGKTPVHQKMLEAERSLKENAKKFAAERGRPDLYPNMNLDHQVRPLTDAERQEWEDIQAMDSMDIDVPLPLHDPPQPILHARCPQTFRRVIGFDLGSTNTGVAIITQSLGVDKPRLESLHLVDLHLSSKGESTQTCYTKLETHLSFLRDSFRPWPDTSSGEVCAVVEYFCIKNRYKKVLFDSLVQVLGLFASSHRANVVVKPSNTQMIHSSNSPLSRLGLTPAQKLFIEGKGDIVDGFLVVGDDESEPFEDDEDDENEGEEAEPVRLKPSDARRLAYNREKDESRKLMSLFKSYEDLSNLNIEVTDEVRNYLRASGLRKLDDIGDAFLHAAREVLFEPSRYRVLVSGQTLFPSNRCVAVRVLVKWFVILVMHVENLNFTVEHIECHPTNLDQKTNLKDLDIDGSVFKSAIPQSFREALSFSSQMFKEVDTIHLVLRQTTGKVPHVMHGKLKKCISNCLKSSAQYTGQSSTVFFRHNRENFHFEGNRLVIVQETSGKHNDARQILRDALDKVSSISEFGAQLLTDVELKIFSGKVFKAVADAIEKNETIAVVDNLLIPCTFEPILKSLDCLETGPSTREAVKWLFDLILCMLNHSVVKPYFRSTRSRAVQ